MIDLVLHEGHEWQPVGPESPLTKADATSNCVVKLRGGGIYYGPAHWDDRDPYRFCVNGRGYAQNGAFYRLSTPDTCDIVAIVRGPRPIWKFHGIKASYGHIKATMTEHKGAVWYLFEDNGKTVAMPEEEARKRIEEIWGERTK